MRTCALISISLLCAAVFGQQMFWNLNQDTAVPASAFDVGFDFRQTAGYLPSGDPVCCTYVVNTTSYGTSRPVNGSSATFGWEILGGGDSRDRSLAYDPRLAGVAGIADDGSTQAVFRLDLPSPGTYKVYLGSADMICNDQRLYLQVQDGTSAFITFTDLSVQGCSVADATGTIYSAANWVTSQQAVTHTFSSTILRVVLGPTTFVTSAYGSNICHLRVVKQ